MIGTNLTFFAMILLGYAGFTRRYATYSGLTVGPVEVITLLHQAATTGAVLLLIGQIIWVWNMVSSYYDGPRVETGDPWDLKEDGMRGREWLWFERKLETTIATDGGEEGETLTDGGEVETDADD
jgi:cytochrome c oxidase subunit 1